MDRVSSLRHMESSKSRKTSSDPSIQVREKRRRSSTITMSPRSSEALSEVDTLSIAQDLTDDHSSASLSQRIELMYQRAAEREIQTKRDSDPESLTRKYRVNDLVSNFEQLSSGNVDKNDTALSRLKKLKRDAAEVVDLQAIEEKIALKSDETTNCKTTAEKEIEKYSSIPHESLSNPKLSNRLKGKFYFFIICINTVQ